MTVKELIEELKKMPQDLDVFFNGEDGPWCIMHVSTDDEPENYPKDYNMPNKWVELI